MPIHIEIDEHGTRWVIDANGRRPAVPTTPNVPPGSETNQQDLESILHEHWTASASRYRPPFDKQWWIAQQTVAIAIDRGILHMRTPDVDALVASWKWAASLSASDAEPIVINANDAQDQPADDPPATIKPPSPLEQIKNHAARSGYEFLESDPGSDPWWHVIDKNKTVMLDWSWNGGRQIRDQAGKLLSLDDAIWIAKSWPDKPASTFKDQIRAHAERAGYDFLESEDARPWWRGWSVARNGQVLLLSSTAAHELRGRAGSSWVTMSEESALRFAESWPSTPNHMALEMVQEWASEPPEPEDSALEEHLAGQAERYVLHPTEQEALKVSRRTGKTPLPPRVIEALKALANIAVLIGLDDWDNPQAVVEAVRKSRQDRCGHDTYAEHVTAYDKLMASHEALVEIASLLGIEGGPQQVAAAVRERVGTWVDGPPTTQGDSWLALETETVVFFDVDELCYPGCKIIAHMPVIRPRYPR